MKFLPLLLAGFRRHKLRTALTLLSVLVAFLLFGYLAAIRNAFQAGVDVAGADRLIVRHRVSIIQLLPQSYEAEIERMDGVVDATHATWFGGIYQDPKNFFPQIPVKPEEYFAMYPEFLLPREQMDAWLKNRIGAVVGRSTAERFRWKIGDRIPIRATIWKTKGGGEMWEFELVGIYHADDPGVDTSSFFFRHDYFDENRWWGQGLVGWYIIRVGDPGRAAAIARAIDDHFANSPAETKTETEGAFVKAFADQIGDIGAIVTAILSAVFFTILLVVGNTIAQSVKERTPELGLLKAVGFSDLSVLGLVLAEALAIVAVGGAAGLGLAWMLVQGGDPTHGALPSFFVRPITFVWGALFIVLLAGIAGSFPAITAMRLKPVDALRRE
ncbi:MAG TPA: ABC transporter permease [Thermoanaerobaculia bacterium]